MRRLALLIGLVVLAGCGGGAAVKPAADAEGLVVSRINLNPGSMAIVVDNPTDEPVRLCQVAVDDGFVPFGGPEVTVAAHRTARLEIPYPWIAGQGYDVKVLTGDGEALEYELEPS
jgi:hypothetical protein